MVKIYTKTGDRGETGLLNGSRVGKDHPRVTAYGEIDELCAVLGVIRAITRHGSLGVLLGKIQRDLFALGAQLADPQARVGTRKAKAALSPEGVKALEVAIDRHEAGLKPLRAFILPGGSKTGSLLHLARTVCRRAERAAVALHRETPVDPLVLVYLNRLSDLLFVLARHENQRLGKPEERW